MGAGHYQFTRDERSIAGFISSNESSTDALGALAAWSSSGQGRSYVIVSDEAEQLVANLSWNEADSSAGPDLGRECLKFGVNRIYLGC